MKNSGDRSRSYYDSSNLKKLPELIQLAPQAAESFLTFEKEVYHGLHAIPLKTKELIALAVAHVTGCPYCIDVHTRRFKSLGGTREEIFEAVLVATSTRAGAVLSHATQSLLAYEDDSFQDQVPAEGPPSPGSSGGTGGSGGSGSPGCFC
ncbi:carboxymuconolactone decarboxylase family protein [Paenibacillus sp. YPG26]|uniref:carboxymuconolactone decarboxylase family protein n=1 Tax=Paenibacillus sp. YPG26 TaxID=2878915 RepID=UPI00203F8CC8|nr:carboxymuconolactone decarboxylase family protein [Paenibacillus sp. YPG26]USB33527.1 carboxymuconolactone decarboxylase family protein [Paenibacillus sp. YPG26]